MTRRRVDVLLSALGDARSVPRGSTVPPKPDLAEPTTCRWTEVNGQPLCATRGISGQETRSCAALPRTDTRRLAARPLLGRRATASQSARARALRQHGIAGGALARGMVLPSCYR